MKEFEEITNYAMYILIFILSLINIYALLKLKQEKPNKECRFVGNYEANELFKIFRDNEILKRKNAEYISELCALQEEIKQLKEQLKNKE